MFTESINSLREKLKAKIKPESSEEEIADINDSLNSLDEIEKEHNSVVEVNGKYKDQIVKMVLNQGDDKKPVDPEGSNPKGMDQLLAEFKAKQEKEDK